MGDGAGNGASEGGGSLSLALPPVCRRPCSVFMAGGAEESGFLQPGDLIRVSAGFLGEKVSRITD